MDIAARPLFVDELTESDVLLDFLNQEDKFLTMRPSKAVLLGVVLLANRGSAFLSGNNNHRPSPATIASMSTATETVPSWTDLQSKSKSTFAGKALENEMTIRKDGQGSAFVHNTLRKFQSEETPVITVYRDHAGW